MSNQLRRSDERADKIFLGRLGDRLTCLFRGHHDLAPADAYGEELPECDEEKELHYCGACGSPVWVSHRRSHEPFHWESRSFDDHLAAGTF
jgi:hypothetical protein